MKKSISVISVIVLTVFAAVLNTACTVTKKTTEKSGVQLWGENCGRCHNAPGPGEFRNSNWDIIGQHMRVRANLTGDDTEKIIAFLKGS